MNCKEKMPGLRANQFADAPTRVAWNEALSKTPTDELWRLLAYAHGCLPSNPVWKPRLDELYEFARSHGVTLGPK